MPTDPKCVKDLASNVLSQFLFPAMLQREGTQGMTAKGINITWLGFEVVIESR